MNCGIGFWNGPGAPEDDGPPECLTCGANMKRKYDPYPGGGDYWVCENPKCADNEERESEGESNE